MRVVIADDSALVRRMLRRIAVTIVPDVLVDECGDGVALSNALQKQHYDIIFTDVYMPGMSGLDAVMPSRLSGSNAFCVFMSTDMSRDLVAIAQKLGAFEFLPKPFTPDEVRNVFESHVRLSAKTRILLVDDSRTTRRIIDKVFHRCRFDIDLVEAESGREAVELCDHEHFAIIFLDVNMPGMDGFETLIAIRELQPTCKFVLISGEDKKAIMLRAAGLDVAAFLSKPFRPGDVDLVLYRLFGLRAPQLALQSMGAGDRPASC